MYIALLALCQEFQILKQQQKNKKRKIHKKKLRKKNMDSNQPFLNITTWDFHQFPPGRKT